MSPTAFTTASAATVAPATDVQAWPRPPGLDHSGPARLPTVTPVPAPTRPRADPLPAAMAASASAGPGHSAWPSTRSKTTAAGTMGTGPAFVGYPRPAAANHSTTP